MKKFGLFFISILTFSLLCFSVASLKENAFADSNGVYVASGEYTFSNNSVITGKGSSSLTNGGGVYVTGGTFAMKSGKITNNTAQNGGGVAVTGGAFTMSGGEISGNTAQKGGGVYVGSSGSFQMSGGTIQNNTASSSDGTAIYNLGTFTYGGGTISGSIYTSKTININKSPSSSLKIYFSGITIGTKIAKIASSVTAYTSDYNVTNLPTGTKLEEQTISGVKYIVVATSGILFTTGGTGTGTVNGSSSYSISASDFYGYGYETSTPEMGGFSVYHTFYEIVDNSFNIYRIYKSIDGSKYKDYSYDEEYETIQECIESVPAVSGSGSQFVGWYINGKKADNSLPRSERILAEGTTVTAMFEKATYTLTFNCGPDAELVGDGVTQAGTGKYTYKFASGTTIKCLRGSYIIGDNEINIVPMLGYWIYNISGTVSNTATSGSTYKSFTPTSSSTVTAYVETIPSIFSYSKITIGCINRTELTRHETIFAYAYLYGYAIRLRTGSVSAFNVDKPLIDAAYYDSYTTEEIMSYVNNCSSINNIISPSNILSSSNVSKMDGYDLTFGDMIASYNEYPNVNGSRTSDYFLDHLSKTFQSSSPQGSKFVPIGNEVSDIKSSFFNYNGYYVAWENSIYGGLTEGSGIGLVIQNNKNTSNNEMCFNIKDCLNDLISESGSRTIIKDIDDFSTSELEQLANGSTTISGYNIDYIVFSFDVFAESDSKYMNIIEALLIRLGSGVPTEPLIKSIFRTLKYHAYIYRNLSDCVDYLNSFGDWAAISGFLENGVYLGAVDEAVDFYSNGFVNGKMENLIEGLRKRWCTVTAVDTQTEQAVNQYFDFNTFAGDFIRNSGRPIISKLTGDLDYDFENTSRDVDMFSNSYETESKAPEYEKDRNLYYDNKKFFLAPLRKSK